MIGERIGRYRIIEEIGAGGMGVVYRAQDERLNRVVALKVLPSGHLAGADTRKRFSREALLLSQLNHPNIATVYDFDSVEGLDFLVMEYIPGTTLNDTLAAGALPEAEVARLGVQMAEGLAIAHEQGVMHRDLKPGNLRVVPDGRLKILDFGLAKWLRPSGDSSGTESLTQTEAVVGTLAYMSPEQLRGDPADARSDIYSMGTVLYEMATGKRHFPDVTGLALVHAIVNQEPPKPSLVNPAISPALEKIILNATEKDPTARYQTVRDVLADLRKLGSPESEATVSRRVQRRLPLQKWAAMALGVVAVAVAGYFVIGRFTPRPIPGSQKIMLAVLPFGNLSNDVSQDYFSDGLTEEMISQLGRLDPKRLGVIARTSAMQYKGTRKRIDRIGRELGVDYVVEGSVRRSADQLRIAARLDHVKDQAQLWSETYDRKLADVFAIQSDVASRVARALSLELLPAQRAALSHAPTADAAAHEAYLKGRYAWNRRTEKGLTQAIDHFEGAIRSDPGYALAWSGLADSYLLLANYGFLAPDSAIAKAKAAARKALALDSTLAEAYASLASIEEEYEWDWEGAERDFKRAIALNPGYATAHQWYAGFLKTMGRLSEATVEIQRARELDPLSSIINADLGSCFYYARRYDRAIEQGRRTVELDSTFASAHTDLASALWQKGDRAAAVSALQRAMLLSGAGPEDTTALRLAYTTAGVPGFWRWKLRVLEQNAAEIYVSPYEFAAVHAALGEKDQAFAWLERAFKEHAGGLADIKVDPLLDGIRSDPRYRDLLRRMRLPAG